MADLDPEDVTSDAEEEMAGANAEETADKGADDEAEEEEEQEAEAEEEQIPQNLHGTGKNPMSRTRTSRPWRMRASWPLKQSPDGGLTSKLQCWPPTPQKS
jgi:septal ring factor EnvC (AmiA/AmiB activator)